MHDTHATEPTDVHPRILLRMPEAIVLAALAAVLGGAVTYLVADHASFSIAARVLASDTIVMLPGTWIAVAITRRLARIENLLDERLERQRRWDAYSDALSDLSGIDGESSTDSGRLPHRP